MEPKRTIQEWLAHAVQNGRLRIGRRSFASDLDRVETIEEEQRSLFDFCRLRGITLPEIILQRLETDHFPYPASPRLQCGNEHEAFYYEEEGHGRVIKITFSDNLGVGNTRPFSILSG